ncbi:mucin-5AC-like [Dreissena polymorpha]|nr:mucin-5AC-like [Dreissena polymorpha]
MFLGGESPDSPDIPDPIPTPAPPTTPAPANRVSDKTQTPADPGPAKIVDAIVTELKKPVDPATIADKVSNKNNKANAGGGKVEEEEELEDLPPTTTEATTTTTTTTPETLPTTTTISTTTSTLPTATSTVAPSDTTLSQVVESLAERIMALLNPKTKKPEDAIAAPVAKPELAPRIAHPAGEIVITDGGRVATKVDDAIGVSLNVAPESVGTSVNTAVSPFDTLVKVAVNSVSSPINIIDSPVYTAIEPIGVSIHTASGPIPLPMNAAAIPVPQVKPAINSVPPPSVADSFMITLHQPQSQGADSSSKTATSGPVSPKSGLQTIDQPKQEFSAQTAPKPARRTVIIVRRNPNGSTSGVQRIIVQGESMGQSSTSALTSSHIDAPNHVTRAPPESALHNTNVNVEVKKAVDRVSSFGSLGIKHDADTERRNKDTHMDTPVGNININSAVHINPTNNHVPMDSFNANPAANVKPIRDSNTPTTLDDFGKHRLVSNRPFSPEALKPLLNTIVFPASQDTAHAQHVASNIQNIAAGNEGILRREGIQRTPILQTVPPADSSTTFHVSANETIETLSPKVSGKDTSNTVLPQSIPKPNADNKKSNKASPVKTDKSEQISARSDQSLEGTASLNQILDNTPTRISPEMLIKEIQFGAKGIAGSVNVNDQALQISQMLVNFLKQGGSTLNEQPLPNSLNEAGDVNAASDFKQNNIQNISPLSLTVNDSLNMKRPSLVDSIPATVDSSSQTVNQHARISLVPAALAPEGHSPAIAEAPVEFAPFMSSNDFGGLTLQRHQTAQSFGTPQQQFNQMDATQVLSALQTDTNTSSQPATIEYVLTSLQNFLSSNLNVQNVSFVSSTPRTTTTTTIAVTPKPSSTSTTTTIPPPPSNNAMNILASLVQLHVPHNMPPDAISVLENIKKLLTDAGFYATTTTTPISASSSTTTTISSTTATTTTTTTVPSTTTATSAAPCTPLSANFRCVGKEMFAAMESMGAWCIGMCVKDACVHTVCECGCNVTQTVSVKITTTQKMPTTTTDEPPEEEEIELEDGMTTSAKPSTTTTVDPVPSELRNLLPTSPSPSEDFTLNPLDKHSAHVRQLNKHVETVTNVAWGSQSKKDVKKAITQLAEGTVFTPKVGASTVESTTRAAPAPNWSGMHWGFLPQPIPTVPEPTPVERSWHRRPLREKWSRSERFSSLINQPTLVQPQLQLPPNMPAMMWIPVPSMANMNPFGQQMSGMRFTWGNQKAGGEGGEGGSGGEGNEANDKK